MEYLKEFQVTMNIKINTNKRIGDVLFIVEGSKTEFYILKKIFHGILGYSYETKQRNRGFKYHKLESTTNKRSRIFVVNSFESNIKFIDQEDKFLDELFTSLINDYVFPVDNSSIYYIFDRDILSNTNTQLIRDLLNTLGNALDNNEMRQGLLLLSYPAVEAFITQNFTENTLQLQFKTGNELKRYNNQNNLNQQKIDIDTLCFAARQTIAGIQEITQKTFNIDDMKYINSVIFKFEEEFHQNYDAFKVLSLLSIVLLDLGIIELEK